MRKTPEERRAKQAAHKRELYADNPQKVLAHHRAWYAANRETILAKRRETYTSTRPINREQAAKRRAEIGEEINEQRRQRHQADPERFRTQGRAWRAANIDRVNAQQRERYHADPGKRMAHNAKHRALKANAPINDLTHAQWLEIQASQDHRCYYCGKRRKGKLSQDHIVALSEGGSHTLHNVVAACQSCNSKKGTGPPPVPVQPLLLTIAPAKQPRLPLPGEP